MAPYARIEEVLTVVLGGAVTVLVAWLAGWWAVLPGVVTLFLLSFYRDPRRLPPQDKNLILAAADGKIVDITRNVPGPDGPMLRIMTFLSVFNVHVNRSPCAGRVRGLSYRRGKFVSALRSDADECNECNTLVIEPAAPLPGPVRVRQIAGVLARRIVCTVRDGDGLAAGARFGMIKLGSRTEVCLPEHPDWIVNVRIGEAVKGGLTVLARLRQEYDGGAGPQLAEPGPTRKSADPPREST